MGGHAEQGPLQVAVGNRFDGYAKSERENGAGIAWATGLNIGNMVRAVQDGATTA